MRSKDRVRLAVIGCGGRGRYHLERLAGFPDVELVAVADASAEARAAVAEQYSIAAQFADITSLLETVTVDAVVLAPPAHLNAEVAAISLGAGIDTLMEKPPGLHSEQTRHLRDLATASGARCMVAWDRRFNPWIVAARTAVETQGPVLQLVGEFHKPTQTIADPRFPEELKDNMLLETPIHAIDVVRALAGGRVTQVHSIVRRATGAYKDVHAALVAFDNGCVAQLTHSYTAGGRMERYELHGVGVSAYLEGIDSGQLHRVNESPQPIHPDTQDSATAQARYFIDCIRADEPIARPAADLDEAVLTMELCEAILAGLMDESE
jgi:predicted dehydrogenase